MDGKWFNCFRTPGVYPTRSADDEASTHSDSTEEIIEIKGDQLPALSDSNLKLGAWEIWALGLTTSMGGHFYLWSAVSQTGFGGLLVTTFLVFTGYAVLLLCMAELASALPFAGGAYGVARVTLGSFTGFLVACFDAYQSMFYSFLSVYVLGYLIDIVIDGAKKNQPIWWAFIYTSYVLAHAWGGRTYWVILKVLSIGSLLLLLIYILGCIEFANFDKHAPYPSTSNDVDSVWFVGGARLFFQALPIPCFFFVGTESLNLAAHDTANPKKDIPWGYFTAFTTISVLTFALIFVGSSVAPGTAGLPYYVLSPLTPGYQLMFNIKLEHAVALSLTPIYTSGFGFTYYYANQMRAMGKSGLVNSWLGYDIPYFNTPVPALVFGAVIGFLVGCRYAYLPPLKHEDLFSINLLGAICVYFSQFISFIMFRWYYPTIKREFTSPLGIYGAVYGIVLFLIIFIVLAGLEASPAIIAFAVFLGLLIIYYVTVVQFRQMFSEEEKTVLFKAYLMKTNRQKQDRIRAGARPRGLNAAAFQYVLTSFFHSPTPAGGSNGHGGINSSISGSNSGPRTKGIQIQRRKPGGRGSDYSEGSISMRSGANNNSINLHSTTSNGVGAGAYMQLSGSNDVSTQRLFGNGSPGHTQPAGASTSLKSVNTVELAPLLNNNNNPNTSANGGGDSNTATPHDTPHDTTTPHSTTDTTNDAATAANTTSNANTTSAYPTTTTSAVKGSDKSTPISGHTSTTRNSSNSNNNNTNTDTTDLEAGLSNTDTNTANNTTANTNTTTHANNTAANNTTAIPEEKNTENEESGVPLYPHQYHNNNSGDVV